MPHFAASNAGHAANFANRKRRKVVMQHERLLLLAFKALHALRIIRGAQRSRNQRLRLATCKERRTMRAREHASLNADLPDLIKCAAVRTNPVLRYLFTEDALAQQLVILPELLLRIRVVCRQFSRQLRLELLDQVIALNLGVSLGVQRVLEPVANLSKECVVVFSVFNRSGKGPLWFASQLRQLIDRSGDLLDLFVGKFDGRKDVLF